MSDRVRRPVAAVTLAAAAVLVGVGPAAASDSLITVIDNSQADSILEVDRTANLEAGSGTAGSDHDGSAVDLMEALTGAGRKTEKGGD